MFPLVWTEFFLLLVMIWEPVSWLLLRYLSLRLYTQVKKLARSVTVPKWILDSFMAMSCIDIPATPVLNAFITLERDALCVDVTFLELSELFNLFHVM